MATRIKIEMECENGHWVGVTEDNATGGKVQVPTHCPHASCGTTLSPWRRRHKASDGLKGSRPVPVT